MLSRLPSIRQTVATACFVVLMCCCGASQDQPAVTWERVQTTSAPPPRSYAAMAYDYTSRTIVLFGGFDGTNILGDTWVFDGHNWIEQHPVVSPAPRASISMTWDESVHGIILFGGYDGFGYLGDTWIWDGVADTWTQANPTTSPDPAAGVMIFTDPVSHTADVFGGYEAFGIGYRRDMWQWHQDNWTRLHAPHPIPTRKAWSMVAPDDHNQLAVLFSGDGPYHDRADTWTWDGKEWTRQLPDHHPKSLYGAGAAFDGNLKCVVGFGGVHRGIYVNTTAAWTGTDWIKLSPAISPTPRGGVNVVADPDRGTVLTFGGESYGPKYWNDTWELVVQNR